MGDATTTCNPAPSCDRTQLTGLEEDIADFSVIRGTTVTSTGFKSGISELLKQRCNSLDCGLTYEYTVSCKKCCSSNSCGSFCANTYATSDFITAVVVGGAGNEKVHLEASPSPTDAAHLGRFRCYVSGKETSNTSIPRTIQSPYYTTVTVTDTVCDCSSTSYVDTNNLVHTL